MGKFERDQLVEEIVSRVDLVEVISEYVALSRKGKDYWGLCPFHPEDTPSFSVSPDKQVFYCFGCQVGGNALTFLRKKDNLTYAEALSILAEKVGVSLGPGADSPARRQYRSEKQRFHRLNELAASFYQETLMQSTEGELAREYLVERGITREGMAQFRLGYAPENWDSLLKHLTKQGYTPLELERCGLLVARSSGGGYYDRFRHRLMFPIFDSTGQVVGFGGRVLGEGNPKYLNSPENRFFDKGKLLYGLHLARQSIQTQQQVVIVEGYIDALMCHQWGISQVVASMGTALTLAQIQLILRYAPEVVLAYDSDEAGQIATLRAMGLIRSQGGRARVASLTEGKDPDELIRKHGADHFQAQITEAQDSFAFKLQKILIRNNPRTAAEKMEILSEFWDDFQQASSELERQEYSERLSMALQVSEALIWKEFRKKQGNARKNREQLDKNTNTVHTKNEKFIGARSALELAERNLLRLMLEDLRLFTRIEQKYGLDIFTNDKLRQIAETCRVMVSPTLSGSEEKLVSIPLAGLIEDLAEDSMRDLVLGICLENSSFPVISELQKDKAVEDYLSTILEYRCRKKLEEIKSELNLAERQGEWERSQILLVELASVMEKIRSLEARGGSLITSGRGERGCERKRGTF